MASLSKLVLFRDVLVTPFWLLILLKPFKSVFLPIQKNVFPRAADLCIPSPKGKEVAVQPHD